MPEIPTDHLRELTAAVENPSHRPRARSGIDSLYQIPAGTRLKVRFYPVKIAEGVATCEACVDFVGPQFKLHRGVETVIRYDAALGAWLYGAGRLAEILNASKPAEPSTWDEHQAMVGTFGTDFSREVIVRLYAEDAPGIRDAIKAALAAIVAEEDRPAE